MKTAQKKRLWQLIDLADADHLTSLRERRFLPGVEMMLSTRATGDGTRSSTSWFRETCLDPWASSAALRVSALTERK